MARHPSISIDRRCGDPGGRRLGLLGSGGFTMLEVAVSMVVVAVGLLGLASVIPLMKADVVRSDQRTKSVFLAQETAEWLHSMAYDDSLLTAGQHDGTGAFPAGYVRSWNVEANVPIASVKKVTVTVDRTGKPDDGAQVVFLHAKAGR